MALIRLAEVLGRLSLAFDIANDYPPGKAVRSTVLAVELGARAGASVEELRDTYWVTLLGYLGGTGFAHEQGLIGAGDDRAVRSAMSLFSVDDPLRSARGALERIAPGGSLVKRFRIFAGIVTDHDHVEQFHRTICDASTQLTEIIGAGPRIMNALEQLCERWDGRGAPSQVQGEAMALPMRLHQIGHVVEIAHHRDGRAAAAAVVRRRAGRHFDPRLASALLEAQDPLFEAIEDPRVFERFIQLEPEPIEWADERRIDHLAHALAIFTDLKSPIFMIHSTGVAALAERAAGELGLGADETRALRLAALLHDIGRVSVPNSIWTHPGPLDWSAWEQVRLHPYYTGRILGPIEALAPVAEIATAAHERLDGSGYPQHRAAPSLSLPARVLAAADMAFAMTEDRPHRAALSPDAIARALVAEVTAGRLDARAVDAVLASLGLPDRAPQLADSYGLSERELEVSQLLARGKSNKEIGALLHISPRTVQIHVARIFDKLGVRSRAGAAIWLIEHNLAR
jgi:HD-GYP domain-containing protein (c-di-GMP phosphodiesterase class II)/DNA-binding CsgD family transcriptional regulator